MTNATMAPAAAAKPLNGKTPATAPASVTATAPATTFNWPLLQQALPGAMYLSSEQKIGDLRSDEKTKERGKLLAAIRAWRLVLGAAPDASLRELVTRAEGLAKELTAVFQQNCAAAASQTRQLETNWCCLDGYFANAGKRSPHDVVILDASATDIANDSHFSEALENELQEYFDRVSLKDAYSQVVVPGWLGSRDKLEALAKICHAAMTLLFTDFEDTDIAAAEEVLYDLNLGGSEEHWASAVLFFNAIVARAMNPNHGEEEHLHVPGSAFVAGKVASHDCLAQPAMGYRNGTLAKALGTRNSRYRLIKIRSTEGLKAIPIVAEDGRVFPYSETTMYTGKMALEKSSYPVARAFYQIGGRDLRYFLNRSVGEIMTEDKKKELEAEIKEYLEYRQACKDIHKFTRPVIKIDKDPRRVWIEVSITPTATAKSFVLQLSSKLDSESKIEDWK